MGNSFKELVPLDVMKSLYQSMLTSREVDLMEQDFTGRGEAFFHVSGAGHEGTAALNPHLIPDDWLHCHYRDKALMMARGITPEMFFQSLFNKDGSHSRGRQMNAHMSDPALHILSLVGPVGNSALQAAGVAAAVKDLPTKPIVLSALGDGMTQQGEVLEGIAHTVRETLPVLWLVEDNQLAISTSTSGRTFYDTPHGPLNEYYGIPIVRVDGRDVVKAYETFGRVVTQMRLDRKPSVIVFHVDRLHSHTNADDHRVYRTPQEIKAAAATGDPIANLEKSLLEMGVEVQWFGALLEKIRSEVKASAHKVQRTSEPQPTFTALKPLQPQFFDPAKEYRGTPSTNSDDSFVMLEAIREVLRNRLETDNRVTLFGEDIEDPKGDVFGLTKGLSTRWPTRVKNSPLAEASILGVTIGQALAGQKPVAFLQFADFLPIAYNQIVSELGSMYWRTDGGWQCPVIVMITCGGYKPGLGPFHASSYEALAVHTPGVDVMMPSTAGDAAGMLNAAFDSGRPTLFFYPKSCLNDRSNSTSKDVSKQFVPLGVSRKVKQGNDITLVGYGNTVGLCVRAAEVLKTQGVEAEVIDLRWLMPWDEKGVVESAERTGRLIIVHEDNKSAGMGSEVAAVVAEKAKRAVQIRRVTREDTFVPCNFANQLEVLPSYKRILETAIHMLGGEISWKKPQGAEKNIYYVEAAGSSPSDESVTVVEWKIAVGDTIEEGQYIADLEADKAAFELRSQVGGNVLELLAGKGDMVKVGAPLIKVKLEGVENEDREALKPITKENPGEPLISGLDILQAQKQSADIGAQGAISVGAGVNHVGIVDIAVAKGSRLVTNEEICKTCPSWTPDDITKSTGIVTRQWIGEGENAIVLATRAAKKVLAQTGLNLNDLDMILVSTGTPMYNTPSMATMLHTELAKEVENARMVTAFDISSACSGYIYALQVAYDHLTVRPHHNVLLVTVEVLSDRTDLTDHQTAPIFGDAATASLVVGSSQAHKIKLEAYRPVTSAEGETGGILVVPQGGNGDIVMDGPKVYVEAVKNMMSMLKQACEEAHVLPEALDLIVPHQANQRIINAIRQRLKFPQERMYSNIAANGNTSSSTIPICLDEILRTDLKEGSLLGLSAFGGGFTFGGGVLKKK